MNEDSSVIIVNKSLTTNSTQTTDYFEQTVAGNRIVKPYYFKGYLLAGLDNSTNKRCIEAKASAIAGMGYEFEDEEMAKASGVVDFLNSLYDKNENPKPFELLLKEWWEDFETFGESRLEIVRIGSTIQNLFLLSSKNVFTNIDRDTFFQINLIKNVTTKFKPYRKYTDTENDVLTISKFGPQDDYYGVPCWTAGLKSISLNSKAIDANLESLDNIIDPSLVVLVSGYEMTVDQKNAVRTGLEQLKSGRGKAGLFNFANKDAKAEIQNFGSKQVDGNYLEERKKTDLEIMALHGITPELFGVLSNGGISSGEKATGALKIFNQTVVKPNQSFLEKTVTKFLQKEFPLFKTNFKLKGIDLTDTNEDATTNLSIVQTYQAYATLGDLELFNEFRQLNGYTKIDDKQWAKIREALVGVDYTINKGDY